MFECQYCKKSYITKSNLCEHQKKAKFCLKIQTELNPLVKGIDYKCEFCNKSFTQKVSLAKHIDICRELLEKNCESEIELLKQHHNIELDIQKERYEKEIESLRQQLEASNKKYEELLNKVIDKSTNTTINNNTERNTYNHNYYVQLMYEKLPEFNDENFRRDYYQKIGPQSFNNVDKFVADHSDVISPYVVVHDESRGKLGIKTDGEQPTDIDSDHLICKTMKIVKGFAECLAFGEMEKATSSSNILDVAEKMKSLNKMNNFIKNSANGVPDKMTKRIGREVSKKGIHTNLIKT